jgi:hypothetical protein
LGCLGDGFGPWIYLGSAGNDDASANLFGQVELAQYSAWCIDRHDGGAWGVGPLFVDEIAMQMRG